MTKYSQMSTIIYNFGIRFSGYALINTTHLNRILKRCKVCVNGLFKLYQNWSFKNVPLPIE